MKYKKIICIITNCIVFFAFHATELSVSLGKKYPYDFFWEFITIIIVSSVFSFIGKKNIKEKLIDFIKMFIVSYLCIIVIISVGFIYTMSRFDMPPIFNGKFR